MNRETIFLKFYMKNDRAIIKHIDGRVVSLNIPPDRIFRYNDQFKTRAEILHQDDQGCYHLIIPRLDGDFGAILCVDKDHVIRG